MTATKKPSDLIASARDALQRLVEFYFDTQPEEHQRRRAASARHPRFSVPVQRTDADLVIGDFFEAALVLEARVAQLEHGLAKLELMRATMGGRIAIERARSTNMHRRAQAWESRWSKVSRANEKHAAAIDGLGKEIVALSRILDTYEKRHGPMISVDDAQGLVPPEAEQQIRDELRVDPAASNVNLEITFVADEFVTNTDGSFSMLGARLARPFEIFVDPGPFPTSQDIVGKTLPVHRNIASQTVQRWIRSALAALGAEGTNDLEMVTTSWDGVGTEPNVCILRRDLDATLLAMFPGDAPVPAEHYAQAVFRASLRKVLDGFIHEPNTEASRALMKRHIDAFVRPRIAILESFVGRPLPLASWSLDYNAVTRDIGLRVDLEPAGSVSLAPAEEIPTGGNRSPAPDRDVAGTAEAREDLVEQVRAAEADEGEPTVEVGVMGEVAHALGDSVFATIRRIGTMELREAAEFLDPNGCRHGDEDGEDVRGFEVSSLLERLANQAEAAGLPEKVDATKRESLRLRSVVRSFFVVHGRVDDVVGYVGTPRGSVGLAVYLEPTHPNVCMFGLIDTACDYAKRRGVIAWNIERVYISRVRMR